MTPRPLIVAEKPPQGFVGVGVGVGVMVGVGLGDGSGGGGILKQSNTASKSKVSHGFGGIGVTHSPSLKKLESKSGHCEVELKGPQRSQLPPKVDDKHHCKVDNE